MGSSGIASTSNSLLPMFQDILGERRQTNDFRWASRPYNPSPYFVRGRAKEPKELVTCVLSSGRVQAAIREVAAKEGRDPKDVAKQAEGILAEMAHDYHLYTVRWFGYILSKLAKNHFSSIFVNVQKVQQIKDCFQRYPVILLPTHRSYIDFLLLSYVCFTFDLPLPIIAAGMDFMGMMGVAELLRKAGAFFIRRRFGADSLYWAGISEYVKRAVLSGSHPLEMFVEGTRSRSGKTLYPKTGLLSTIAELVKDREIPDVLILPISISYDRTLEEGLYARELLGQPKPKESTNGLIKGLRWLQSQSYGSMYVNFGEFISIRECLSGEGSSAPAFSAYRDDAPLFSQRIQGLGMRVVLEQQRHLVTPLFSGVATVILTKISQGHKSMGFPKLMNQLHGFRALIKPKGLDFGLPLTGETLEANVRHILGIHSALVVCPRNEEHVLHFQIGDDETVEGMTFQHYANQFVPLVLPYAIFAVITNYSSTSTSDPESDDGFVPEGSTLQEYIFLRELLFDDFIYDKGTEAEEATKSAFVFNTYLNKGRSNGHSKRWTDDTEEIRTTLRQSLEPFLIAYWGVAKTILQLYNRDEQTAGGSGGQIVEVKQLAKMSQSYLRQLLGTHFPHHFGALSLDTLNNACMAFIKLGYASKIKMESGGSFGVAVKDRNRFLQLIERLESYLPLGSRSPYSNSGVSSNNQDSQDLSQLLQLRAKL